MTEEKKVVKLPDRREKQIEELQQQVSQRAGALLAQDPVAQRLAGKIEILQEQIAGEDN
jgi:hypothetical protein